MRFTITIDGATSEQIERAGQAALGVLSAEGITPEQLAEARHTAAGWEEHIFSRQKSDDVEKILVSARQAEAAAVQAAGWPGADVPTSAQIEVVDDEGRSVDIAPSWEL
jgi:hypothetical protein